jgi:hypothetical protein
MADFAAALAKAAWAVGDDWPSTWKILASCQKRRACQLERLFRLRASRLRQHANQLRRPGAKYKSEPCWEKKNATRLERSLNRVLGSDLRIAIANIALSISTRWPVVRLEEI